MLRVLPPKVFYAEPFPTVCFRSQPPPHARADDTADFSSVSHLAISACSTEIQHVTLGILCLQRSTRSPAVTESARSFPLVIIAQATSGNQVRDGSFAPGPRRHGGQPTSRRKCQDRSCSLALCWEFASLVESIRCWHYARESLSKRSVYPFLSKRSARWLRLFPAGATPVWSIAVAPRLDPRMHSVTESSLMALALYGVFDRLRHAIWFRGTSHVASSFLLVARPSTALPGHF